MQNKLQISINLLRSRRNEPITLIPTITLNITLLSNLIFDKDHANIVLAIGDKRTKSFDD